ncbi:DUF5819 family protein [Streptomyces sp. PTD5-9]|uniref:DUF5819 family protein n=1 Tax=Streptomyces sp. PTD5-9 TaxID=3120150 RepID=UPI0030091894
MDSYDDTDAEAGSGGAGPGRPPRREAREGRADGPRPGAGTPAGVDPGPAPHPAAVVPGPEPESGPVAIAAPVPGPGPAPGPAADAPGPGPASDLAAASGPGPAAASGPGPERGVRGGMAALSLPYQIAAAVALSVIGLLACGHLAMVFLHVAPSNTLTKQHGEAVDEWIYPEFEQNWKLFAPNPLQQNVAVHVRAEVAGPDGRRTTPWMSLSGEDAKAIRGSLAPSHVHQNALRRGWDFYVNSHDNENRPNGLRGNLSESYIRRLAMQRLGEHDYGGTVERIQLRSETRSVAAPAWSNEKINTKPFYRELPWWTVTPADIPGNAEGARK